MTDESWPVGVPVDNPVVLSEDDAGLVDLLRAGDADAFARIVEDWSPSMLRLARAHVLTDASAEEMVQETWLAVVRGLDRFEGRSSLKTWVFSILTNQAKSRGVRESRALPWSSLGPQDRGPTVDREGSAVPTTSGQAAGRWRGARARGSRLRRVRPSPVRSATGWPWLWKELPDRQRVVVSLRDVHGLTSDEVCATLGITGVNQRVLLHRGRAGCGPRSRTTTVNSWWR